MSTYEVVEVVAYRVEADSEEEAVAIITGSEDPNRYFTECRERYAREKA